MIPLVLGAASAYAALFAATLFIERSFFSTAASHGPTLTVALNVLALPVLATWLAAELVDAAFHKRLFDRRVRRPLRCAAAGACAGLLGVLLATLMLVLLDRALPDALLTGIAAAASTAIVLTPLPRRRSAACPRCGYDLSGATPASGGVCTECGFALIDTPTRAPSVMAAARSAL